MNTATHSVEVPFPQAFASPQKKRSPFPSAPGTVKNEVRGVRKEANRPSGVYAPPCEVLRSLFSALANTFVLLPVILRHGTQETRFSCQGAGSSVPGLSRLWLSIGSLINRWPAARVSKFEFRTPVRRTVSYQRA